MCGVSSPPAHQCAFFACSVPATSLSWASGAMDLCGSPPLPPPCLWERGAPCQELWSDLAGRPASTLPSVPAPLLRCVFACPSAQRRQDGYQAAPPWGRQWRRPRLQVLPDDQEGCLAAAAVHASAPPSPHWARPAPRALLHSPAPPVLVGLAEPRRLAEPCAVVCVPQVRSTSCVRSSTTPRWRRRRTPSRR